MSCLRWFSVPVCLLCCQVKRASETYAHVAVDVLLSFVVEMYRKSSPDLLAQLKFGDDGQGGQKMALLQVRRRVGWC